MMTEEQKKHGKLMSIPADVWYGRRDWTEAELEPGRRALRELGARIAMEKEKAFLKAYSV